MAKIMATEKFNFTYVYTPTGEIHGSSFIQQTEDAINNVGELAIKAKESADKTGADFADVVKRVDVAEAVSNNALSVANTANSKADTTASVMEAVRLDVQTANGLSTQALEKARTAESNSSIALGKSIEAEKASATAVSQSLEAVNSSAQASASALSSSNEAKVAQQKAIEAKNSASSAEDSARRSAQMAEEARNRIGTTPMPTAERMAKAWPDGVLIYDIELDTLFCGDGQTVGGKLIGGERGPKGDTGPRGPKGDTGPRGPAGGLAEGTPINMRGAKLTGLAEAVNDTDAVSKAFMTKEIAKIKDDKFSILNPDATDKNRFTLANRTSDVVMIYARENSAIVIDVSPRNAPSTVPNFMDVAGDSVECITMFITGGGTGKGVSFVRPKGGNALRIAESVKDLVFSPMGAEGTIVLNVVTSPYRSVVMAVYNDDKK